METVPIQGLTRSDMIDGLSRSQWFRALRRRAAESPAGGDQLDMLVDAAQLLRFAAGETIVRKGDPSEAFLVLLQGQASVHAGDGGVELGRLQPPATLGEVSLLLDEPRTATVVAREEVLAASFSASAFRALVRNVPEFGWDTSRYLASRVRDLSAHAT